jgi:hypothetical protein
MRLKTAALLPVLFALTALALVSSPKPASAFRCHCTSTRNTRTFTGTGATCSDAQTSASNQAFNAAETACSGVDGTCTNNPITSGCTFDSGTGLYSATSHSSYSCDVCI